ncbi:MAG TPA: hypothetical protein VFU97_05065 [Xanthobacteraceae bacterium]|nr:hypothetical protein [Xanthobacteraceae bacterium]
MPFYRRGPGTHLGARALQYELVGLGGLSALPRSEEYRRFAQECLEMSRTTEDERSRAVLIQMAQVWLRLAQAHEANAGTSD